MVYILKGGHEMNKRILVLFGGISIILLIIGIVIGNKTAKVDLNNQKISAEKLQKEISQLKNQKKDLSNSTSKLNDVNKQITDAETKLDDLKKQNQEVLDLVKDKDDLKKEYDKAASQLSDIKKQLSDAKSDLDSTNDQVDKASGTLQQAKGEPKTLSAGNYVVGSDLPAGRYKAVPVGEGSNFFVRDPGGSTYVNTILGNDGEASYTFECSNGDTIETESSVKLIPLK